VTGEKDTEVVEKSLGFQGEKKGKEDTSDIVDDKTTKEGCPC